MTLYSIQSFKNVPIYFRDSVLDSLTVQQKRVILIASVAFSCIALLYLYCKYGFKAKQNQEKQEDKPDDKPLIPIPLPGKHENSDVDKQLFVEDKKGADQRQLEDEKKPIVDDKKTLDDKKQADKKTQADTKNEDRKIEEEKKKDDQKDRLEKQKQADPLPSPLVKNENVVGPVVSPKVDPVETSRIIYQGLGTKSRLTESQFEDLSQKFDSYRQDFTKQVVFFLNLDRDVFVIDLDGFAKTHGISVSDLEALCRYLILEGKIYAYHRDKKSEFKLYLTEQASLVSDKSLNIKRLKEIDSYMESLSFPSLDQFTQDEKETALKVIKEIKISHYKRILSNHFSYIWLFDVFSFDKNAKKVMDTLVRERVIHSWNVQKITNHVLLKIKFDDPCDAAIAQPNWRDLDRLQQEDMFQKAHHISIGADLVKLSHLIPEQQQNLWELVEGLNDRVKPGVCYWHGEYGSGVLDFLKQNGFIHDYKLLDRYDYFEIYVSATDI